MVAHCVCVFCWLLRFLTTTITTYHYNWARLCTTRLGIDTKEEGKQRAVRTCVSLGRTLLAHSELGMVSQGTRGVGTLLLLITRKLLEGPERY